MTRRLGYSLLHILMLDRLEMSFSLKILGSKDLCLLEVLKRTEHLKDWARWDSRSIVGFACGKLKCCKLNKK